MCIGVTIACLPPSVAISGYLFWYQGQKTVLSARHRRSFAVDREVPDQSFKSYAVGLATLGGAYYVQSLAFPFVEGGTIAGRELREHAMSTTSDHYSNSRRSKHGKKQFTIYKEGGPGKYAPPRDLLELARRVAPPIALRVAASSIAFFCAGVVQTYVALRERSSARGGC